MKMLPGFQRNRHQRGIFAASSLLLLLATQTFAQSGRRAPKPAQPVPTPQTDSENTTRNSARDLKQHVSLIAGKQVSSKHLESEDAIFASFINRLRELNNVTAKSIDEVKRGAAIKQAKQERESIVVLLEFDVDEFQNATIIINSPDLDVKILVFEPKTGNKKFEGNVYYKAVGGPMLKRDNWPSGPPIRMTTDAVGIEAAEQVYDWLIVRYGSAGIKRVP